jgi:hypothetical protein
MGLWRGIRYFFAKSDFFTTKDLLFGGNAVIKRSAKSLAKSPSLLSVRVLAKQEF